MAGVTSAAVEVEIQLAPDATKCAQDAECASGFCVDGVCCDALCGETGEACTAALKGSGQDGVCGAVPPERDPNDDCVLSSGAPSDSAVQCNTGFCVDGVCCDGSCVGQCEACDVAGSEGQCVPTTGAPHASRPACQTEPPADLCDAAVCDGIDRTMCSGTIGPCLPYACTIGGCLTTCGGDGDCAVGHHCEDGMCLTGSCQGTIATTPEGQQVDCAPFICQEDGSCRTSCADVSDCASPFGCDFQGRCVQRPPNDIPSDCACRAAAPQSPRRLWMFAVLGLGLLWRRRRRGPLLLAAVVLLCVSIGSSAYAQAQPAAPQDKADAAPAGTAAPASAVDEEAEAAGLKKRMTTR